MDSVAVAADLGDDVRRAPVVVRRVVVAVSVLVGGMLLTPASPAGAAGVTTHGWMATNAIDLVTDPVLHSLLDAHREQVRAGGMLPDAGYVAGNTFGEEAHWQRFIDAYIDQIRARTDCGDITDPTGPCSDMIAHALGMAAHGMGDEVWDWLFEPYGPDLNEYWTDPGVSLATEGGAEFQMDIVAVGTYGVPRPVVPALPSADTLLAAFEQAGLHSVTASQFNLAGLGEIVWDAENNWATEYLDDIQAAMPWMSANMVTAPGGVDFGAQAIAGFYESLWGRILGDQPATEVSITYPAPGQIDVPASGWERTFQPGSSRGRGGARNRIAVALTYARPYQVPGGPSVANEAPAGSMTIVERDTDTAVPIMAGYPRSVPYGADSGERMVDVQPANDLAPCTWYEVRLGVDAALIDANGEPVTPHTWSFRTDDGAGGTECDADTGGTLTGTVTGPGGAPIAAANVWAYRLTDGWAPTAATTTNASGAYQLSDLPDGSYQLVFWPATPGLAPSWSGGSSTRAGATVLEVPGPAPGIDAQLSPATKVSGRVTGPGGTALAGAQVWAFAPRDTWVATRSTTTGVDGTYSFDDLPQDSFHLAFTPPPGSDLAVSWYHDATSKSAATPVATTASPVTGIDQQLEPATTLSGKVTGPGGEAVPGAKVSLFDPADTWMWSYSTVTAADGTYVITGVVPDTYQVQFSPPASSGLATQWFDGAANRRAVQPVVVTAHTSITDISASLLAKP